MSVTYADGTTAHSDLVGGRHRFSDGKQTARKRRMEQALRARLEAAFVRADMTCEDIDNGVGYGSLAEVALDVLREVLSDPELLD